ncbi:MAG: MbnH family di-heme enzyme [Hyphomicrobiaceae bacterium]
MRSLVATVCLFASSFLAATALASEPYKWQLPPWMPPPTIPADNPMSPSKVELGRRLFYDIRLSGPGYMSCASCHLQKYGFSDHKRVPLGITGQRHHRNAMSLANIAYFRSLTWAGPDETALESQLLRPLFGQQPVEMAAAGHEVAILELISSNSVYRKLFTEAFPETEGRIDFPAVGRAIAAFERTLISARSPYDHYHFGGQKTAISAPAKRGEQLFFGDRLKCGSCHIRPHFTDAAATMRFHNTGLYNVDGRGGLPGADKGLANKTGRSSDVGKFRTPSLRNVAVSAPYMHDGSLPSLDAVIDHYRSGGLAARTGQASPLRSPLVAGFAITQRERADLIAFLKSLTDQSFLTDPRFATPFK